MKDAANDSRNRIVICTGKTFIRAHTIISVTMSCPGASDFERYRGQNADKTPGVTELIFDEEKANWHIQVEYTYNTQDTSGNAKHSFNNVREDREVNMYFYGLNKAKDEYEKIVKQVRDQAPDEQHFTKLFEQAFTANDDKKS